MSAASVPGRPLLAIEDLSVRFETSRSVVYAVNGVSLRVDAGECVVVIGESGSGKTVTTSVVLGLLDEPPAVVEGRSVRVDGVEILGASTRVRRSIRARKVGMVFQDPTASLDPSMRVGSQIVEVLRVHDGLSRSEARRRAVELLALVGIADPHRRFSSFPHELSGGMRQRAMLAIAIALRPGLLIADEPTTALDTTVQAQILELLQERQRDGMGLLLITHDLGVAARIAQRIVVMYAGSVVEEGPGPQVLRRPGHPYTQGLLACTPNPLARSAGLKPIMGSPPVLSRLPRSCPFADRCPHVEQLCREELPPVVQLTDSQSSRCHFAERIFAGAEATT